MDRRMANELDNYITGHYGEDQFRGQAETDPEDDDALDDDEDDDEDDDDDFYDDLDDEYDDAGDGDADEKNKDDEDDDDDAAGFGGEAPFGRSVDLGLETGYDSDGVWHEKDEA